MADSIATQATAAPATDAQRRRSDRVRLNLPVKIEGKEASGQAFAEFASATNLSRSGGTLRTKRNLPPGTVITVFNSNGTQETPALVVGQSGLKAEGHLYGIKFLTDKERFWGISFPPVVEDKDTVAKVVIQCSRCGQREVTALNEIELEVFEVNDRISRACEPCHERTLWRHAEFDGVTATANGDAAEAKSDSKPAVNRRKSTRVKVTMKGCILVNHDQEDPVTVLDMSRGGIRFRSKAEYVVGDWVQVAVPYTPRGANIFETGRIVRRSVASDGMHEYGFKYVKM
jgi:hypothetical protein